MLVTDANAYQVLKEIRTSKICYGTPSHTSPFDLLCNMYSHDLFASFRNKITYSFCKFYVTLYANMATDIDECNIV